VPCKRKDGAASECGRCHVETHDVDAMMKWVVEAVSAITEEAGKRSNPRIDALLQTYHEHEGGVESSLRNICKEAGLDLDSVHRSQPSLNGGTDDAVSMHSSVKKIRVENFSQQGVKKIRVENFPQQGVAFIGGSDTPRGEDAMDSYSVPTLGSADVSLASDMFDRPPTHMKPTLEHNTVVKNRDSEPASIKAGEENTDWIPRYDSGMHESIEFNFSNAAEYDVHTVLAVSISGGKDKRDRHPAYNDKGDVVGFVYPRDLRDSTDTVNPRFCPIYDAGVAPSDLVFLSDYFKSVDQMNAFSWNIQNTFTPSDNFDKMVADVFAAFNRADRKKSVVEMNRWLGLA
jgi:hypothetical protein